MNKLNFLDDFGKFFTYSKTKNEQFLTPPSKQNNEMYKQREETPNYNDIFNRNIFSHTNNFEPKKEDGPYLLGNLGDFDDCYEKNHEGPKYSQNFNGNKIFGILISSDEEGKNGDEENHTKPQFTSKIEAPDDGQGGQVYTSQPLQTSIKCSENPTKYQFGEPDPSLNEEQERISNIDVHKKIKKTETNENINNQKYRDIFVRKMFTQALDSGDYNEINRWFINYVSPSKK